MRPSYLLTKHNVDIYTEMNMLLKFVFLYRVRVRFFVSLMPLSTICQLYRGGATLVVIGTDCIGSYKSTYHFLYTILEQL